MAFPNRIRLLLLLIVTLAIMETSHAKFMISFEDEQSITSTPSALDDGIATSSPSDTTTASQSLSSDVANNIGSWTSSSVPSSSTYDNNNNDWTHPNDITTAEWSNSDYDDRLQPLDLLKYCFSAFGTVSALFWLYVIYQNRQYRLRVKVSRLAVLELRQRQRRRMLHHDDLSDYAYDEEGEEEETDMDDSARASRYEEIIKRFYFQTVRSDKSNSTLERVPSCPSLKDDVDSRYNNDEENPFQTVELDTSARTSATSTSTTAQDSSGSSASPEKGGDWFQSWRKATPPKPVCCCICLEGYAPKETICVPITNKCSHVFHEDCMVAWLQRNDECPLCRVDLMKEEK